MSHAPVNGGKGPPRLPRFKHWQSSSFSHPVNEIKVSIDRDQRLMVITYIIIK